MPIRHTLSVMAGFACLLGCSLVSSDQSPDELRQLMDRDKVAIYFLGQTAPAAKFPEKIGPVEGRVCQSALLQSITEFQALQALWSSAQGKGAKAVVNTTCGSSSFLLLTGTSYCWPGYYCEGEAVK
ncbi:MAG TPA: hypothetical protein VEK12_17885 [Alphaproteobacteria bacterium]|nr:hypothetical protein [Alphaproteobacteria bacterium]